MRSFFSLLRFIVVYFTLQFQTCASELKFHACSLNDSLVSSLLSIRFDECFPRVLKILWLSLNKNTLQIFGEA